MILFVDYLSASAIGNALLQGNQFHLLNLKIKHYFCRK